jgi:ABC-type branched-subunit amino acid transport system permease subunit
MTDATRATARGLAQNLLGPSSLKRLAACLFGGVVLALMVGKQHGTRDDFHVGITDALFKPRIGIFLVVGLVIFVLVTFWPLVVPYLTRPGTYPLGAGLLVVIGAQTIMNWYDPLASSGGNGKFGAVGSALGGTSGLLPITEPFFSWLAWTLAGLALVVCGYAIITRVRVAGYAAAVIGVAGAILAYVAHADVVNVGGGYDHSLGVYADIAGFLVLAGAGITAARSSSEVADTRRFLRVVNDFRPGLVLALGGLLWGLLAFTTAGWFGTGSQRNDTLSQARDTFSGTGISGLASQYLSWLGWVLFAACAALTIAATYLRRQALGWAALLMSLIAVVLTFLTLQSITTVAADVAPNFGSKWKNLGAGGFAACLSFTVFAAAAALQIGVARGEARIEKGKRAEPGTLEAAAGETKKKGLPVTAMVDGVRSSSTAKAFLIIALGLALFYPPTLPVTWQNVLVGQIGVFVLLAIGLNVVVGWAGLLDLGYIAFYEIGAYTTAYLTGVLPVKPPHWLHAFHSPLWSIPVSIIACLIAGVLLGAPTLRLRGDYLAIVTLGFGEIIQILAVNNPYGFTGGPQGPTVPHPSLHVGGLNITWGQDNLPYWYLLLVMLIVVLVLFYRLEGSRLGRAWAAIREDEVAAQASGVNTMRVKLLAFAIGASTSALAGWFFATQVGYFDPSLFTLQTSILVVAYVVFGGMGSLQGAVAGAAVLTWLPQFLKDQVPAEDRQMWIGALVLAMMIFRPAGLLPAKRRKAELEGLDSAVSSETAAVPRAGAM